MKELTSALPSVKRNPPSPKVKPLPNNFFTPLSIHVNEGVCLKSVLTELAKHANCNLHLDPKIKDTIIFQAHKKPFIYIIDEISSLANLRYSIINNSLRIEVDKPYSFNYDVQFLNLSRKSENRISTATDVFSTINTSGTLNDNGSNSAVTVSGKSDFWAELNENLKTILATSQEDKPSYSIHKQAGIVTIFGTFKHHKNARAYFHSLREATNTQVLIEAKIIEVLLKDEFRAGINWQKISGPSDWRFSGKFGDFSKSSRFLEPTQSEMITLGAGRKTFSALLSALEQFGSARTLSSPRLTVMNNQTAILKVAHNQVYFRLHYDKQLNTAVQRENISVSSDIQTVPIGLVMSVQPSIDAKTNKITLFLRPTISKLKETVADPAVSLAQNNTSAPLNPSLIPVVEVREIDSILSLENGEMAILGGLMEIRSAENTTKLPILGDAPLIKDLFRSHAQEDQVIELVILLKAHILNDNHHKANPADLRLMNLYIPDPRPF